MKKKRVGKPNESDLCSTTWATNEKEREMKTKIHITAVESSSGCNNCASRRCLLKQHRRPGIARGARLKPRQSPRFVVATRSRSLQVAERLILMCRPRQITFLPASSLTNFKRLSLVFIFNFINGFHSISLNHS